MSNKLDVVSRMASLYAIDADRVAIRRVARLAPVEVVHGKRRVTRYLVEALSVRDRLLHGVLVVEYLVAAHYRLDAARETQAPETVVEYLVELERGGGVVRYLDARRQPVEYAVPSQYRVALGGYQDARLGVPEYVVLLQDALAPVEDADSAVSSVEDLKNRIA